MKKIILVFLTIFIFNLNVHATDLSINLSCPSTIFKDVIIECDLIAYANNGMINGINANYNLENATLQSFVPSNDWSTYNNSNNGFVIGNTNGINGKNVIGKLKFAITNNELNKAVIGLTNLGASDLDYNDITVSNVTSTIKIIEKPTTKPITKPTTTKPADIEVTTTQTTTTVASNNALLDSLNIDGVNLEFNKNKFEYEVNVGIKKNFLNISGTTNPENTISGLGRIPIHDGENIIIIRVTDKNRQSNDYVIKVLKKNNIVSNNKDEIIKAFETNDEVVVNLKTTDNQIVDKDIINIVKSNDKKITYNIYDRDEILYYYEFSGEKIDTDVYNNINLKINFNNKDKTIDNQIKDNKKIVFENEYKGFFPTGTKLNIKNITEKKEESINLYKINVNNNLELINSNVPKLNNNYFSFEIEKGSKYVLSSKKINENNFKSMIIISTLIIIIEIAIIGFLLLNVLVKKDKNKKDVF